MQIVLNPLLFKLGGEQNSSFFALFILLSNVSNSVSQSFQREKSYKMLTLIVILPVRGIFSKLVCKLDRMEPEDVPWNAAKCFLLAAEPL